MGEARTIAVEELLAESDWIRRLARALLQDADAAEDVAQQALVAALERPPKADRPLRPWLRVVVENFARMRRRSDGARLRREEQVARPESETSTEAAYERVELQRTLASEVLALEEPFRETVVLHYYASLTSVEIAKRTGTPEGTIRWRLKRGLEQLRQRLDRRHGGDRTVWLSALAGWVKDPDPGLATGSLGMLGLLLAVLTLGVATAMLVQRRGGERELTEVARPGALASEPVVGFAAGEPRSALEPDVIPAAPATGRRLHARVVDGRGQPVEGARASVGDSEARSSPEGRLSLALAPEIPRTQHLSLELAADGFVREQLDFVAPHDGALEFGDVRLARAGALEGRLVAADNGPLESAWVRVEVLGSRWQGIEPHPVEEARYMGSMLPDGAPFAAVDERGAFRVEGLREGYVRLWFGAAEHEVHWADEIAVRAGRSVDVGVLTLQPLDARLCIEGRVLDPDGKPLSGALVECARQSLRLPLFRGHSKARRATADADGRFRLWVEPNSRYHLGAADALGRFRSVSTGALAAGDHDVELRLAEWRPLEVLALDADARPIADARVELVDARRAERLERETEQWNAGRWIAPWCDFQIVVHAPGCLPERLGPFRAEESPAQVVARPAPAPLVRGHVRSDGVAAAAARVELMLAADPTRGTVSVREPGFEPFQARVAVDAERREVRVAADGSFELAVMPGQAFFVRAVGAERAPLTLGPYELAKGESLDLTFDLPVGGALVGNVVRVDGKPPAGTLVGLSRGDGLFTTCRVDASGRFEFRGLEPGAWQVRQVAREALGFEPLQLVPGGGSAPRWDVTVEEARESRFELALDDTRRTRLVGALRFDGLSAGPWGVEARLGAQRATAVLDPDGKFELELPREGEWVLAARWAPRGGNELEFSEPLARWSGSLSIERDWVGGSLEVDVGPSRSGQAVSAIQSGPGEARLAVHAVVDATGVARFARIPAGKLRIELEDGDFVESSAPPGYRQTLIWPVR